LFHIHVTQGQQTLLNPKPKQRGHLDQQAGTWGRKHSTLQMQQRGSRPNRTLALHADLVAPTREPVCKAQTATHYLFVSAKINKNSPDTHLRRSRPTCLRHHLRGATRNSSTISEPPNTWPSTVVIKNGMNSGCRATSGAKATSVAIKTSCGNSWCVQRRSGDEYDAAHQGPGQASVCRRQETC